MIARVAVAVSLLAVCALETAHGQTCSAAIPTGSCTVNTTTTMTAGTVLQLSLTASATTLTAPGTASYDAGFVADNGPTATVKSNRGWTLHIAASNATWTASNTVPGVAARPNKPAADLLWSTSSAGPFAGVTVGGATATSGGATGGTSATLYYRTLYGWTLDTPGAYSLPLVFTLTAP